jgi:peptidoglycan-associated lipoprotein
MKNIRMLGRTMSAPLLFVLTACVACGTTKPPEPTTPKDEKNAKKEPTEKPTKPTAESVPNTGTASAVKISDEILKACGIPQPEAYFAFDSANLRPQDTKPLDKVADCFISGPLKGRLIKLVGHADPRGDADYNFMLGQSRADAVQKYLTGYGVEKPKVTSTSRGAQDATGTDDASWAQDRRVDLVLGN